jgi:hypothetical protein
MTLRNELGDDAARVHDTLDSLLDSEDCVVVLVEKDRMVSFSRGFGLSPCQLELLTAEIERTVRAVVGAPQLTKANSRQADNGTGHGDSGAVAWRKGNFLDSRSRGIRAAPSCAGQEAADAGGAASGRVLRLATGGKATDIG